MMAAYSIDGGMDTTRVAADADAAARARQQAGARKAASEWAADLFGVHDHDPDNPTPELIAAKLLRDELCEALGLDDADPVEAKPGLPKAPTADPENEGRVVVKVRIGSAEDDWRRKGACRDEHAELFHPIGTSGPAALQAKRAKAVCGRCPVTDECLEWALKAGSAGIWGGTDDEERRAIKRSGGLPVLRG